MKRSVAAALLAILLVAVLLRLLPLLGSLYWGSDFGEYLALTRAIAQNGVLPTDYRGWGITYPSFPGLYALAGAFVTGGASAEAVLSLLVPALAAFAVLPTFLVAVRVTRDELAALIAAAFLAVVMFHVYPTSHGIPASLADVLLIGGLLMFLGLRRQPKFFVPLLLTALAIVVTHHLTGYVLLVATAFALVLRAALDRHTTLRAIRYEFAFLAILAAATLAFWGLYARSLWTLIVQNSPVSSVALVGGTILIVAAVPVVVLFRSRLRWRFTPKSRSVRGAATATGIGFGASLAIVGFAVVRAIPGTTIALRWQDLVAFVPTFAFLSIAAAGRKTLDFTRHGPEVTGWFLGLLLSVLIGALAAATVLIPYRHLEYFAVPVAVMAGAGWRWLSLGARTTRSQIAAAGLAVALVSGTAAAAYPPPVAMAGFQEGISNRSVEAALWIREQADGLVAGDHRMSTIAFGIGGVDATWDRETRFWHTTSCANAVAAMQGVPLPNGTASVRWIALDGDTRAGLQTTPFEPALPLPPSEAAKFETRPFHKAFDSGAAQVYFYNAGLACP